MAGVLLAKTKDAATFGGNDGGIATGGALTTDEQENEEVLADLESIQHIYNTNEFKRQVLSRISSKGFQATQLAKYFIENSEKERIDKEMLTAMNKVTNVPYKLNWKGKKAKTRGPPTSTGKAEIECDLYLQLTDIDSEKSSVQSLLKDVAEVVVPINKGEDNVIDLNNGDWIWMEIAETPESLKDKMKQLERAYRHFEANKPSFIPKCFVVCLNGEKAKFMTAANHIKGLFNKGELGDWQILSKGIPCLVTYTPYRNVYEDFETVRQLPTPDEAQAFYEYHQMHSNSPAWGKLSFQQQAKLVWLNMRGHDDFLVDNLEKILENIPSNYEVKTEIDLITHALDPSTPIGSRLDRVMQKGGNKSSSVFKTDMQRLETILENYSHWADPQLAPTIFNGGYAKKVTPFYRIQADNSSLCYLIAPSSAIFYCFSMPDKPLDELGYVVNINKYVRNIFHSDRSFKYIFYGAGGYSGEALFDFLEASNEGKLEHDVTLRIDLWNALYKDDPSRLYNDLKDTLFHYGPAVVRIRVFQELLDCPGQVEWSGLFQEKKELDKKKHPHDGHALLMVGVRLTPDEHGGIQFLLQNSWSSSMWFIFGLDLLRSMGEAHEQLVFIRQGVKYERKARDSFKFAGRNAESWSPSAAASVEMVENFGDFEMSGGPHSHPSIHKPNYTMADQEGLLDEDIITSGNFVVET